ncbi:MAG TPA: zf-HC2 domain-containing protein, partial [Blastocatellia bacterium]|nr:zf-HC2 domain-containing protein [Blastocatellia bacterium]
ASAYLDRELTDSQAVEYRDHLAVCAGCREHLAETEAASLMLRRIKTPDVPRELHSYIMTPVVRRASGDISLRERVTEWLLKLNPIPLSYAAGVTCSIMLFTLMLSGVKPIPAMEKAVGQMFIFPAITGSDLEYHRYNDIPADLDTSDNQHYYQLPRVLDNSALVSFSNLAYQKPGNDGMAALIEVGPDGRAKLVNVLDEPKDSRAIEQLWWSLSERTFQPALVEGRPVSTRIVLLVEKVDVTG